MTTFQNPMSASERKTSYRGCWFAATSLTSASNLAGRILAFDLEPVVIATLGFVAKTKSGNAANISSRLGCFLRACEQTGINLLVSEPSCDFVLSVHLVLLHSKWQAFMVDGSFDDFPRYIFWYLPTRISPARVSLSALFQCYDA